MFNTSILYFSMFNYRKKKFHFKESNYTKYKDEVTFLKRLEDDQILFDKQIYPKDFFDYDKLEKLLQIFYNEQQKFIINSFLKIKYNRKSCKRIKASLMGLSRKKRRKLINYFSKNISPYYIGMLNKKEYFNRDQYDILDKAYKYEFPYKEFKQIKDISPSFFYEAGWNCIKPVFSVFKEAEFKYYDEDGKKLTKFNYLNVGDYYETHMVEYSEKKKYNEFDIYSTTNTYAKYNLYNDFYYKDYKGEKFSTKSNFEFTEEEIKENFYNVTSYKTIDKFNIIKKNEKNKRYLDEFTQMLLDYEQQQLDKSFKDQDFDDDTLSDEDEEGDNLFCAVNRYRRGKYDLKLNHKIRAYWFSQLNDPRNILILPLIDCYLELWRLTGYGNIIDDSEWSDKDYKTKVIEEFDLFKGDKLIDYEGYYLQNIDESFTDYQYSSKKEIKMMFYYDLTLEYQEHYFLNFELIDAYEDEYDEEETFIEEDIIFSVYLGFFLFYFIILFVLFSFMYYSFLDYSSLDLAPGIKKFNFLQDYYLEHNPKLHYQLVSRKGRCTLPNRELPPLLYNENNISFIRKPGQRYLPHGYMQKFFRWVSRDDLFTRVPNAILEKIGRIIGFR